MVREFHERRVHAIREELLFERDDVHRILRVLMLDEFVFDLREPAREFFLKRLFILDSERRRRERLTALLDDYLTQDRIDEGSLAMVDVRDDSDVANVGPTTLRRMQTMGSGGR